MKAAVIYERGEMPQYAEVPEPVVQSDDELLIIVKAAAIKHIDKSRASGKHYSLGDIKKEAIVVGGDGVGVLEDGTKVFAIGESGMIAEKAIIDKHRMVILPKGIDDVAAAALPNAVAGSAMALRFRANMKEGETVLINGATSFTGKIAVQIAKQYGAKHIIATGRNEYSLQSLLALGADETVLIKGDDKSFVSQIKEIHKLTPVDIILDYLWGHSAELIFDSLKGQGSFTHKTRFISIGAITGDIIRLSAENMRSVDLQLSGSGLGSWAQEEMKLLFSEILPEMFDLAVAGKLTLDTISVKLEAIETLWNMDIPGGKD